MDNQTQKIEMVDVGKIKPYPKNAKKHTPKQINHIAGSITEFGFNQPIVVDSDFVIIAGHGRYLAATEVLNLDKVPTLMVDLSEEQAKAYRLVDNKLNESAWDKDLLLEELKSLSLPMLELSGFKEDLILKQDPPEEKSGCARCEEIIKSIRGHVKKSGHDIVAELDKRAND